MLANKVIAVTSGKGGGDLLADKLCTEVIVRLPIEPPREDGIVPLLYEEGTVLYDHYNQLACQIDSLMNDIG
jgi:ATP-binding protein involved in chromosome partitioning